MSDSLGHVLSQIQRWTSSCVGGLSDTELLERFVYQRDDSAFAALVARHGGMVLRSCRRVLGDVPEAEDAFQATFLILARKARTLRRAAALPGFLHSVARRVALKAQRKVTNHGGTEQLGTKLSDASADPLARLTARELLTVCDEEVARLPMEQRLAVVLCCLEGHTQEEAARLLGWTAGSLRGHLERGRNKLRARLERRGITLSAALAVAAVSRGETASALLLWRTVKATLDGRLGSSAMLLARSVLHAMFFTKAAGLTAVTVAVALAATITVMWYPVSVAQTPDDKPPAIPIARKSVATPKSEPVDRNDDPLPPHALARLGTLRFRHDWRLTATAISADGCLLAGTGGGYVQIWDAKTGRTLQRLPITGIRSWALALAFTPDGRNLASYEEELKPSKGPIECPCRLRIADVATGKTVRQFDRTKYREPSRSRDLAYIAFLAGGKQLLLREGREVAVHLLDAESGKEVRTFPCPEDRLSSVASSADGQLLAVGGQSGTAWLWEIATGKKRFTLKKHSASCGALTFSPDSRILASGDTEGVAHLWDVATGQVIHTLDPKLAQGPGQHLGIGSLSFAPDGKCLLSSHRYWVVFWDTVTGKEIRRLPNEQSRAFRYLPDGKTLIAGGDRRWYDGGNTFRFVDVETGKPCRNVGDHGTALSALVYSPDGKYIATCDEGNPPELRVWEASSSRVVFQPSIKNSVIMTTLAFSPKGDTLATAHWNTITLWDLKTGKPRRTMPNKGAAPTGSLAFSADGTRLACAGQDDSIRVWDLAGERELLNLHVGAKGDHGIHVRDVCFSSDLRIAAYAEWDADLIRLWDLSTGKLWKSIKRGGVGLVNVTFSPDGRTLLEASEGGRKMFMSEVASGQLRRALPLPSFAHWDLAYAPDGRRLALAQDFTGGKDEERRPYISIVDLASNRPAVTLFGHQGRINALSFSPDSRVLASGSTDSTALLWDVAGLDLDMPAKPQTQGERANCWNDFASDAPRAYDAMWRLVSDPGAVELFRERIKPAPAAADAKLVGWLLADLESDQFPVRASAQDQLAKLGTAAEARLRDVLSQKTALELQKRAEMLIAALEGQRLRTRRAIETLELMNTGPARELLRTLAAGSPGAWLTAEAKESLSRLLLRLTY